MRRCSKGFHLAPGYAKIRSPKKFCVKDCGDWSPPRVRVDKGRCVRPKSAWLIGLLDFYQRKKASNPSYKYSQAMMEFGKIYRQR